MDIAAFLTDRLDEDEQAARLAGGDAWSNGLPVMIPPDSTPSFRTVVRGVSYVCGSIVRADAEHIARHDPARVLTDVAVKRAIVAVAMSWDHNQEGDEYYSCSQAVHYASEEPGSACYDDERAGNPCDCGLDRRRLSILGPLAAVYADHPDFDPAWREETATA